MPQNYNYTVKEQYFPIKTFTYASITDETATDSVNEYDNEYISEYEMFNILDKLRPTTSGLDQLPAWFLRLGAPVFTATCLSLIHI